MKYLKCIYFIIQIGACFAATQAHALEKSKEGFCHLSPEVLANPDLVIQDAMENSYVDFSTNCNDVVKGTESEFSERGLTAFPINGNKIKRSGWGIYREYKIRNVKPGEELDGYQTLIYEVELIYIAMSRDGPTLPICEYSKVPMRVVQTPWGWRFMRKYGFGSNLKTEIKKWEEIEIILPLDTPEIIKAKKRSKSKEINLLLKFASQCKLKID